MVHKGATFGNFLVLLTCESWSVATPVRIMYEDPSQNEVLSSEHTRPINWESNSWKLMPNRWSSSGQTSGSPIERADELQELEQDAKFLQSFPINSEPIVTTIAPNIAAEGRNYDDYNELSKGTETPEMGEYEEIEDATTMTSPTEETQVFLQSHEDDSLTEEPTEIPVTATTVHQTTTESPPTVPRTAMTRPVTGRRSMQPTPASQSTDAADMAELEIKMDELIALAHRVFFRGTTTTRNRNSGRRYRPWFPSDSSDYEDTIVDGRMLPRRHGLTLDHSNPTGMDKRQSRLGLYWSFRSRRIMTFLLLLMRKRTMETRFNDQS